MLKLRTLIPNKLCLRCDVCCRFPDKDSPYAPLFLPQEINFELKPCLDKSGRVKLKHSGNIYICHFFNTRNNKCSIYSKRPFDCRLYPFIITFDERYESIILAIDTKCPFAADPKNQSPLESYSKELVNILEQKGSASLIAKNPSFIGSFHNDITKISTLDTLTKILINNPEKRGFKRLSLKDKITFDTLSKKLKNPHSSKSFVNLYIWKTAHEIWWRKKHNNLEILIESDSDFLPFNSMKKFPDYIYLRKDLAELKGRRFKHKRASCNYFSRHYKFQYLPFKEGMKAECLKLFLKWTSEKKKKIKDPYFLNLLDDSFLTHKRALENYKALGLVGRIIKIRKKIRAYTFGFELTKDTFCILLEVCDLASKGISQFIFREFSRELTNFKYINTMDDSGLENLKSTKLSYHPIQLIYPQQI